MRELVLELMGEYGNLAVFLLILVENLFPPIPSEVILTFGGVMTVCTDMTPVLLWVQAGRPGKSARRCDPVFHCRIAGGGCHSIQRGAVSAG